MWAWMTSAWASSRCEHLAERRREPAERLRPGPLVLGAGREPGEDRLLPRLDRREPVGEPVSEPGALGPGRDPGGAGGEAGADHRHQRGPGRLEHRLALGAQHQERLVEVGRLGPLGGADPDRLGAELGLQRRLELGRPQLGRAGGVGAEGVVVGLDAPDRPGDQRAEQAQRLGLAAEPARVADHLVADEAGGDQVGEHGRPGIGALLGAGLAEELGEGGGLGQAGIHGTGPLGRAGQRGGSRGL